jgi:hypothetical protein
MKTIHNCILCFLLTTAVEYKHYAPDVGLIQDGSLRLVKYGFVKRVL